MFYTYIYQDPERNVPMYVGKGKDKRARIHLRKATNIRFRNRITALKMIGLSPIIEVFEMPDEDAALKEEVRLIALYGRVDLGLGTLYNGTNGGEGKTGYVTSEETKLKIGLANKNASKETKIKQSSWIRDEVLRKKISEARIKYNSQLSEEEKIERARRLSKECLSLETRDKMSKSAKARPALTCPHCGKVGKVPGIRKHHFEFCKSLASDK